VRAEYSLRKGYLRLRVKPPQIGSPGYYNLDGSVDAFDDNDEKFLRAIEQMKEEARGTQPEFVLEDHVRLEITRHWRRSVAVVYHYERKKKR
jgi:hypothetical protein